MSPGKLFLDLFLLFSDIYKNNMLYSPPSMLKTFLQKISGDGGLRVPQENCFQYVSLLAFGY